jgi:hypothetical protein
MEQAVFLTNLEFKIRNSIMNLDVYNSPECLKCEKNNPWGTDTCDEFCFATKVAQWLYKDVFENKSKKQCRYCFNARTYQPTEEELNDPFYNELTDENDFSSIVVGCSCNGHAVYLSSGAGSPLRLEVLAYNDKIRENQLVGEYFPKFCPECGRAITEYERRQKYEVHQKRF